MQNVPIQVVLLKKIGIDKRQKEGGEQILMLKLVFWFQDRMIKLRDGESGAAAVEYGLLVALIAAVVIGAVTIIGTKLNSTFCQVVAALPGTPAACP